MDALDVVVFDVSGDRRACGGEVVKAVLPGAFLFEGANEPIEGRQAADRQGRRPSEANQPLAQPVLLGCVGCDVLPHFARPTGSLRLAISATLRFLREAVVAYESTVGPRAEDQAVVVAQGETCGSATGGAEAMQQGLFQRTLGSLGAGGVRQFPAENFTRAAVDDRHEGAPAVAIAVYGGDVGGPALVGSCGNGLEMLHTWSASGEALPTRPAVQAHDAVDLLAVDDHALSFGEAGMGHAHAIGGMSFDHRRDGLDAHRIALRLEVASTRLVVGGGACHAEQTAQHADRHRRGSRLEELILHGYHEIPSGKSLP